MVQRIVFKIEHEVEAFLPFFLAGVPHRITNDSLKLIHLIDLST